jgi:hypothetical protein
MEAGTLKKFRDVTVENDDYLIAIRLCKDGCVYECKKCSKRINLRDFEIKSFKDDVNYKYFIGYVIGKVGRVKYVCTCKYVNSRDLKYIDSIKCPSQQSNDKIVS